MDIYMSEREIIFYIGREYWRVIDINLLLSSIRFHHSGRIERTIPIFLSTILSDPIEYCRFQSAHYAKL